MNQSKIKFSKAEEMVIKNAVSLAKESLLEKKELGAQRRYFRKKIENHLKKFIDKDIS